MYQVESSSQVIGARRSLRRRLPVPATVLVLGWTSFLTDISSEMVASVLPIYLMVGLQLAPMQLGLIDGLQQGASALVRLAAGVVSDRWRRHKEVAAFGYGLSALSRLGLLAAGASWTGIAASVTIDRIGKGIRTAPRDAMIAMDTRERDLATAFGVHRAFDTAGAMLGPIVAFALLALLPGAFDVLFVVSFCVAMLGLGVIVLFARPSAGIRQPGIRQPGLRQPGFMQAGAGQAGAGQAIRLADGVAMLARPRFRMLVAIGALLGLTTLSDGFLYLTLQQRMQLEIGLFPLLFVITAGAYLLMAIPAGVAADRFGRRRMFLAGYATLPVAYGLTLLPAPGWPQAMACLVLLGAHYAATDGVLAAMASRELPEPVRASGLALLATAIGVAKLCASLLFGLFWSLWGMQGAVLAFGAALLAALACSAIVLHRVRRNG